MPSRHTTPKRRDAEVTIRRTRSGHATARDKSSDESDSESSDIHQPYSSSTSMTSVTGTEKSSSDKSPLSDLERTKKSPQSHTSSPGSTPSHFRSRIYPDLHDMSSEKDESYANSLTYSPNHGDKDCRDRYSPNIDMGFRAPSDKVSPRKESCKNPTREGKRTKSAIKVSDIIPLCVVMVFIGVVVFYVFWYDRPSSEPNVQRLAPYECFRKEIKGMQLNFPNQSRHFWKTIIASSKHILDEQNSTYPSVIILASQLKSPHLNFCFARKIATSFLLSRGIDSNHIPSTDIRDLQNVDVNNQKLLLDKDIQTAFQKPNGKAYVIRNLNLLSPQAALLLHGLCDGDNAPYKDVMILMTLEIEDSMPIMTSNEAEDYLVRLWTTAEVDFDKVSALMSRISNSLVMLHQEDASVLEQMCSGSS